jgi:hypothetical protein
VVCASTHSFAIAIAIAIAHGKCANVVIDFVDTIASYFTDACIPGGWTTTSRSLANTRS